MTSEKSVTKQDLIKIINELENNPSDKIRILGDIGIGAVGAGLGTAAAGSLAAIAGVSSIPVLTTAASWIGVTAVAATPVGWIVGVAAVGAALTYGVSRLIRDGGLSEGRKRELLLAYQDQLREMEIKERSDNITPADRTRFITSLRELIEKEAIAPPQAFKLIEAVERGTMPISQAYALVAAVLTDSTQNLS